MQGNKLDDQFIDRAWVEMQKLLDEQMPVAIPSGNKKRLAFLWLFLLLGLISGSLGLGLWWNKSASPAPAAGIEKNEPVALDKALPVTGGEKVNTPAPNHSLKNNSLWQKSTLPAQVESSENSSVKEVELNTIPSNANSSNQNFTPVKPLPETQNIAMQTIKPGEKETESGIEANWYENNYSFTALLPTLAAQTLDYYAEPFSPKTAAAVQKKGLAKLLPRRWGVETALVSNSLNPVDGFSAGLFLEYPIGYSKWLFKTGLGMRQHSGRLVLSNDGTYSYNYVYSEHNPEFNNSYDPNIGFSPAEEELADAINGYRAVLKNTRVVDLTYIDLPVLFSYRFAKRLRVETGAVVSYRLERKVIREEFTGVSLDASATGNYSDFEGLRSFDVTRGNRLNSFDLAASLGMQYFPASKLGLGVKYDYGLIRLNEIKSKGNFNRNLRFSLSYYFK